MVGSWEHRLWLRNNGPINTEGFEFILSFKQVFCDLSFFKNNSENALGKELINKKLDQSENKNMLRCKSGTT